MSQADEDPELRELVTDALEKSGVLAAVRAHLRAGVFLALEREHDQKLTHHAHLQQMLNTQDGRLALLLVHELLEFCRLRHTASVYSAETGQPNTYTYKGRESLLYELKVMNIDENSHLPVLVQLISVLFKLSKTSASTSNIKNSANTNDAIQSDKVELISPDNYDTTFTSDSTNHSLQDDRSKAALQTSFNGSEEVDKSLSDQIEDDKFSSVSEHSVGNNAHIELHTDSEKSYSDNVVSSQLLNDQSLSHSEMLLDNIDIPIESSLNSPKSLDLTSVKKSLEEITPFEQSTKNDEADTNVQEISNDTVENNSSNSFDENRLDLHLSDPSHTSNNSERSSESIAEEIIRQEDISESLTPKSSIANSQSISNIGQSSSKCSKHNSNNENSSSSALSTSGGTKLRYSKPNFNKKNDDSVKKHAKENFKGKPQVSNSKINTNVSEKHPNKLLQKNNERLSLIHNKSKTSTSKNLTSNNKINSERNSSKSTKAIQIENINGSE